MLPLFASSECFALRAEHNGKFLQSVHHKSDGGSRIEASADTVAGNARARFFVEPSEEHEGWVHIRYCYNNKYWVFVLDAHDDNHCWYVSAAHGPNEDMRSDSCTLFKPILEDGHDNRIRLQTYRYTGSETYACMSNPSRKSKPYLQYENQEHTVAETVFIFNGLSRDKELPKYVAFKGDDGKYIQVRHPKDIISITDYFAPFGFDCIIFDEMGDTFLQFNTKNIGDDGVFCTVITNEDGTVRIKSNETGVFWRRGPSDWIVPTKTDTSNDTFKVITGDGFIALQNLGNQRFCNRSSFIQLDFLKADGHSISKSAQLVVEEPVFRREISDLKFHLQQARIHSSSLVSLETHEHTNDTEEVQIGTFSFKKKKEVRGTWGTIVSSNTADVKKFSASIGKIPIIIGGEVTLSREDASAKRHTESKGSSEERTITQNFTVPPGKTVRAEFVATQASYDVPYSYKRMDILTNGETILTVCEDGLYTGVNQYKFRIIMTES